MKALLCVLALAIPATVFGDEASKPPLVTTSGTAEIRVVPDLADLSFGVTIRHANLEEARKQQAERSTKVLAALRAAGVAETNLKADQIEISPIYSDNREETSTVKFYSVSQSITCTLKDLSKVTDITANVVTAGATFSRGATLRTSELRKYRDEARIKAIRIAKEKATDLATELGAKIGKPYSITEGTSNGWNSNGLNLNIPFRQGSFDSEQLVGDEVQATFAPGTISISATIEVSFVLE